MQARDFRSIDRAAQEELRCLAQVLIEQQDLSQGQTAQMIGVHRQAVNTWVKRHRAQGEEGVLDGRRVSPRRGKGILSTEKAGQVRGWIVEQTPDQLGLPFGLWTSRASTNDLLPMRPSGYRPLIRPAVAEPPQPGGSAVKPATLIDADRQPSLTRRSPRAQIFCSRVHAMDSQIA